MKIRKPAKVISNLLDRLIPRHIGHAGLGDYCEIYNAIYGTKGRFRANLWCWIQIFRLFYAYLLQLSYGSFIMFRNYIKIAFRNVKRHKSYSAINIFGLAVGIACSLTTLFYILDESRYDQYHEHKESVYRLVTNSKTTFGRSRGWTASSAIVWAPNLKKDIPEIDDFVRFSTPYSNWQLQVGDQRYAEDNIFFADASLFDIFSWPLLYGDPGLALNESNSVVISAKIAKKYFGENNPVGKTIILDPNSIAGANARAVPDPNPLPGPSPFVISGVLKQIPKKSHFSPDFLLPFSLLGRVYGGDTGTGSGFHVWFWRGTFVYTYIKLKQETAPASVVAKFPAFLKDNPVDEETSKRGFKYTLDLQNITNIHYSTQYASELGSTVSKTNIYMFSIIAAFILLIASINFTNLSIARSVYRSREVGMRKVVGAQRQQLIRQFLGESMVLSSLALVIAVAMTFFMLPKFYQFLGKPLTFTQDAIRSLLPLALGVALVTGIFAGGYPAFIISAFRPVAILKNTLKSGTKGTRLRRSLVVAQFSISIFLIIATITVIDQLAYMQSKNPGFDRDQVLVLPSSVALPIMKSYEALKAELLQSPNIAHVAASSAIPGRLNTIDRYGEKGQSGRGIRIAEFWVDPDFAQLYDFDFIAGRDFSQDIISDHSALELRDGRRAGLSFIINETAVDQLGWSSPEAAIGKMIMRDPGSNDYTGKVIGVIRDFHFLSLREIIQPIVLHVYPEGRYISIKIRSENVSETINFIRLTYEKLSGGLPFDYSFLDEDFDRVYESDKQMGEIFGYIASLAVIIACLGLFGLASFTAESRSKEIGVRKVLGASTLMIVNNLSKEFIVLVAISNIITWPFAYYAMTQWLAGFAYRISSVVETFILAGVLALAVALITVGLRTFRAAKADPIHSLRFE